MIESLSAENSLNLKLKQGDVLSIKKIPSWEENQVVDLSGEVRFPGSYAIRKNEKIYDLITRAGGLTEDAFLKVPSLLENHSLSVKISKPKN